LYRRNALRNAKTPWIPVRRFVANNAVDWRPQAHGRGTFSRVRFMQRGYGEQIEHVVHEPGLVQRSRLNGHIGPGPRFPDARTPPLSETFTLGIAKLHHQPSRPGGWPDETAHEAPLVRTNAHRGAPPHRTGVRRFRLQRARLSMAFSFQPRGPRIAGIRNSRRPSSRRGAADHPEDGFHSQSRRSTNRLPPRQCPRPKRAGRTQQAGTTRIAASYASPRPIHLNRSANASGVNPMGIRGHSHPIAG